jgi:hypothetical protein
VFVVVAVALFEQNTKLFCWVQRILIFNNAAAAEVFHFNLYFDMRETDHNRAVHFRTKQKRVGCSDSQFRIYSLSL